jgi:hypothetical protein
MQLPIAPAWQHVTSHQLFKPSLTVILLLSVSAPAALRRRSRQLHQHGGM